MTLVDPPPPNRFLGTAGAVASHFASDTAGKWFGGFCNLMINGRLDGAKQMAFAIGSVEIPGGEEAELALDGINAARETMDVSRVVEGAEGVEAASRTVVIGEDMTRVRAYADEIGASTYPGPPPGSSFEEGLEHNRQWLRDQIEQGAVVHDIGPVISSTWRGPTAMI